MYIPSYLIIRDIVSHAYTRYEFRQGKPTVVAGENLDDPSQEGNGSGKSGLIEAIAIAFTGSSIRNVSMRKLVRKGCEFGEVEYGMYNAMFRNEVVIKRKLYAGGKAQEVTLIQNGEQVVLSEVNEYNKRIFEILAISKEDFFNFYLITKEYYKPFLLVGDTTKKEIVNRFSGAEKIDNVNPAIDQDVKDKEVQIASLQRVIDINTGKQEIVSEQITKLQVEVDPEKDKERVEALTLKQSILIESAENYSTLIETVQFELAEAEKVRKAFEPEDYDLAITLEKGSIQKIAEANTKRRERVPKVKEEFQAEIDLIKTNEANHARSYAETKVNIREAQQILTDLENALAGTVHCPKCAHEFILADHDFDIEQAKKDVAEAKEVIEALNMELKDWEDAIEALGRDKEAVNQKVAAKSQEIRDEIAREQDRSNKLQEEIGKYERLKLAQTLKVNGMDNAVRTLADKIEQFTKEQNEAIDDAEKLQTEIDKPAESNEERIEELESQLLTYLDEGEELSGKLGEAQMELQGTKEWYSNFKSFKSFLANQSIRNVQDYTNLYLQHMGSNLSIEIEGYKKKADGKLQEKISTIVCRGGFPEDEYGCFSGGERGRIDVACILAIQHLINLNSSSGGLDLLVADEIFDSIDSRGLEYIIKGLLQTQRTVLFISQVQTNTLKEHTLVIRKENKISAIVTS